MCEDILFIRKALSFSDATTLVVSEATLFRDQQYPCQIQVLISLPSPP